MITQQMIIGTSFYSGEIITPWPTGTDPGSGLELVPGIAQLGFWKRHYPYYFADNIAGLLSATPDWSTVDGSFQYNDNVEDYFSAMWTGYLQAPATGTFKFRSTSDDSSYFWIGTDAITDTSISNCDINNGGLHGSTTVESDYIYLTGGLYYPIRAVFGENDGAEVFYMEWNQENQGWSNINMAYSRYNADNSVDGF